MPLRRPPRQPLLCIDPATGRVTRYATKFVPTIAGLTTQMDVSVSAAEATQPVGEIREELERFRRNG